MFLGSFRTVELFQILVDAGEQVRVVPLEGAGRVQHILDDLPHPPAVGLVRECLLSPLDDGGDLSGQAFLLGGRHSRRAPVAEGIGIPILVLHLKGRDHFYVHTLLPDPNIGEILAHFSKGYKKSATSGSITNGKPLSLVSSLFRRIFNHMKLCVCGLR